jgi:hypothetical protein
MLARSSYDQPEIDAARATVRAQLDAFDRLPAGPERDAFAPVFGGLVVVALEAAFMHRARGKEGKDGNPLNEVRVLAGSILAGDGVMGADKTIKMKPEATVLGLAPGDALALSRDDVARLAEAFFAELETRFGCAS